MHPAMEFIDGRLIYGTTIGEDAYYITSSRTILPLDQMSDSYYTAASPRTLRFSPDGIQNFMNGDTYDWLDLFTNIFILLSNHVKFKSKWQTAIVVIWILARIFIDAFLFSPTFGFNLLRKGVVKPDY
jgi:hypothetical protein